MTLAKIQAENASPPATAPDVSVIVVSYNVVGLLEECLTSILQRPADGLQVEIIVVDNASADGSAEMVAAKFPGVKLVANRENYGFPRGCNQGLRLAAGRFIFFLNPDARIEQDGLARLVKFLESRPEVGVCAPLLRYSDGTPQPNRRRFPSYSLAFVESTILQRYRPFRNWAALRRFKFEEQPPEVAHLIDWPVGAAFLVRRAVTDQIGGLDERFFMYSEEVDFCKRVQAAGWQVWYNPEAVVTHAEGRSSGQDVPFRHINFNTSKISYYRKHYGRLAAGGLRGFLLATYLFQYAEEWFKLRLGHKPELRRDRLQLIRKVLAHGFRPYQAPFIRPATQTTICLLTAEYPPQPGGVGDYTACLENALRAAGSAVFVLNSETVLGQRSFKLGWGWRSLPQIAAILKLRPAQVVNIQYQTGAYRMHPAVNFLPLYLKIALGKERPQVMTTFHDLRVPYLFPKAGSVRQWVNQLLLKSSDVVIVTNEADLATAQAWGAKNLQLVPIGSNIRPGAAFANAAARQTYRAKWGIEPQDFAIGYFGLTNRSKGVDTLLQALAELLKSQPACKLVLIGGATGESDPTNRQYFAELTNLTQQLGLESSIVRTGHLPPAETSQILYALDAAALPFRDGATFRRGSLLATLAHGLPVVTTLPAAPQLIDGHNVLLVPPENPAALVAALTRIQNDPALAEKLGRAAQILSQQFEWPSIADRLLKIIGTLHT